MAHAVVADFDRREQAEHALQQLLAAGVEPGDISVILEESQEVEAGSRRNSDVGAGAFTGAVSGAILGGLAGWILSLGVFDLYGVGRIATEYATGATLAGAALGAALLGLLGAIAGLTFGRQGPVVEEGDVLMTVRTKDVPAERIAEVMRENNAVNVQQTDTVPDREPQYAPGSLPHRAPDAPEEVVVRPDADHHAVRGTPTVTKGQDVYTIDNHKLGEVTDVTGDYFTVDRGMFHHDLYIPYDDLHDWRPEAVYVNAVRDEVELKSWQERPLHREHHSEGPTRP